MTTVAAFLDSKNRVAIGADFAVTAAIQYRHAPGKLKQLGGLIVGFAGIVPPPFGKKVYPATELGVYRFANDYIEVIEKFGHGATTEDGVRVYPVDALVVLPGKGPYWVGAYGGVVQPDCGYVAIGSGNEIAAGSMWMSSALSLAAEEALECALGAAGEHDPNTSPEHAVLLVEEPAKSRTAKGPKKIRRRSPQGGDGGSASAENTGIPEVSNLDNNASMRVRLLLRQRRGV